MSAETKDHSRGATLFALTLTVLHLIGVATALDAPERIRAVTNVVGFASTLFYLLGTLAAARSFSRGDYLRTVWAAFAVSALMLHAASWWNIYWRYVAQPDSVAPTTFLLLRMLLTVVANAVQIWALLRLVGTYRQSGLQPPTSWRSSGLWALGAGAALAIAVPTLRADFGQLGLGPEKLYQALTSIGSTVGDCVTIFLVVPLLRVAYMLRGGRLAQVWWAMALGGAVWLVYDVSGWLAPVLPGDSKDTLTLLRVLNTVGYVCVGLSGWLQQAALASEALPADEVPAPKAA